MSKHDLLTIGTTGSGKPFTLLADLGDKKIAILAQSKKGKTYGLGDILEELVKAQRPFIATDPANNFWGLRCLPDGSPSGLDVVVIGGDHADIPFEKDQGERMAEALIATAVCAVIDTSLESKGAVRHFMTAFADRLMRTKPGIPRVIVLEECPDLIPQHAFGAQAQICKSAVSRLATIGGNFGYGVIPACQRAAVMDKDVLSQCEGLIVLGMTHKKDRTTVKEWMEAKDIGDRVKDAFDELGSLKPGEAWYWNPSEDRFERFTFRQRHTLHPREMTRLGLKSSDIRLGNMKAFVDRMRNELTRTVRHQPNVCESDGKLRDLDGKEVPFRRVPEEKRSADPFLAENLKLRADLEAMATELKEERSRRAEAERRLASVKAALKPQYDALTALFVDLATPAAGPAPDRSAYDVWMEKAPQKGIRVMIDSLLNRGPLTFEQLCTLAGVAPRTGYNCLTWLKRNHLVSKKDKVFHLAAL